SSDLGGRMTRCRPGPSVPRDGRGRVPRARLLERVVPHRPPQPCRAPLLRTAGLPIRRRFRPDGEAAALKSFAPNRAVLIHIVVYVYSADVPLVSLSNPVVLPLLGLLVEQPAHPYELTRRLAHRYPTLEV